MFEGIAKTNTTNTCCKVAFMEPCLRVLLKQIQQTPRDSTRFINNSLRVLLKQIQQTQEQTNTERNIV